MIKDYRHLLRNDAELASAAADISTSCRDISEFLLELAAPSPRIDVAGLRVACQVPCSMRNGQRIGDAPARLLQRWGFKVDMAPDDETCCGSAGTYNLLQPRMAELLGQRKADAVDAAGIDVVASGNLGCMLQMSRFSSVPFLHTVQLLDWVSGGARPAGLSQPADQH